MFKAYVNFWKGYVDFTGRSTRKAYWLAALMNGLIAVVLVLMMASAATSWTETRDSSAHFMTQLFAFFLLLYFLATLVPSLAIRVRRLRDAGLHWAYLFMHCIPSVGGLVMLVLYCQPTKPALPVAAAVAFSGQQPHGPGHPGEQDSAAAEEGVQASAGPAGPAVTPVQDQVIQPVAPSQAPGPGYPGEQDLATAEEGVQAPAGPAGSAVTPVQPQPIQPVALSQAPGPGQAWAQKPVLKSRGLYQTNGLLSLIIGLLTMPNIVFFFMIGMLTDSLVLAQLYQVVWGLVAFVMAVLALSALIYYRYDWRASVTPSILTLLGGLVASLTGGLFLFTLGGTSSAEIALSMVLMLVLNGVGGLLMIIGGIIYLVQLKGFNKVA